MRLWLVHAVIALLAVSPVAQAQQSQRLHRVGFIASTSPVSELLTVNPAARAFARGMLELGYIEGRDLVIEWRSAEGSLERTADIVRELVSMKIDVIVTVTDSMTQQAKDVTRTVPIVMAASSKPVELGLVRSLALPGGNVTGLTMDAGPDILGKRLQLLKELLPGTRRVAVLGPLDERAAEMAAQTIGIKLHFVAPDPAKQYANAFASLVRPRLDAVLVAAWAPNFAYRRQIADFAARNALPVMYPSRAYVEAGGLVSYGLDVSELFRHSASYVGRILRGAKPADLPIERPTKFELVVNLRTAKAMGLAIPPLLLVRADELIQ